MEAEKEKPRGGGGGGGGERKPRSGPKKSEEPKYNDTDESKAQLEKIRLIEAQMKEVQQKLVSGLTRPATAFFCSFSFFFLCFSWPPQWFGAARLSNRP